ncbi:MAG: ribokinase [Rubrivivax sp.]
MLLVFGSINLDLSFRCARLPLPGETVLAESCLVSPGGKGANQAHAAQRFGMPTRLVGAVGDDLFAEAALQGLRHSGVDLSGLQRLPGATGCAGVSVDALGENQIVVAAGVNLGLCHDHVADAMLSSCGAVLLQMETDLQQNIALVERARRMGVPSVLNNAPAQPLPPQLLRRLDVLIVNASELRATAHAAGMADADLPHLLAELADAHALTVIVTLGGDGVMARAGGETLHLPAHAVAVRDTTGAGDTFAGVFAAAWVESRSLHECLSLASVAAALACTRSGAQLAQPTRADIDLALPAYAARLKPMAG